MDNDGKVSGDGGGEEVSNVNICRCHIQNFYWSGGTGSSVAWTSREDNEQIHICMISTHYYKQLVFSISICLLMFSRSICCASIFNWFSSWYFWNIACSSKKTKHLYMRICDNIFCHWNSGVTFLWSPRTSSWPSSWLSPCPPWSLLASLDPPGSRAGNEGHEVFTIT